MFAFVVSQDQLFIEYAKNIAKFALFEIWTFFK